MRGPEEWPSHRSNPAGKIRLTGPAAIFSSTWAELTKTLPKNLATRLRGTVLNRRLEDKIRHLCALATAAKDEDAWFFFSELRFLTPQHINTWRTIAPVHPLGGGKFVERRPTNLEVTRLPL